MDLNDQIHLVGPLKQFDCSANEVLQFKFIRSEDDLVNDEISFSPEFTHQIFGENERIFGYKNLRIDLFCLSSSLNFYLNIQFDEKINPKKFQQFKADDLTETLKQWIPSETTTNLDKFLSKLKDEKNFRPFGEEIFRYEMKSNGKKVENYSIHRYKDPMSDDQQFVDWYSKLETFLVFFIDAASSIDKDDPNWIIYLLYQEYSNESNQISYYPIGFITVYRYYAYPEQIRPRISQVMIFPPYQRQGHGRKLLTTVFNDLRLDPKVRDITAEDPSDEFISLRDLVTFELCQKYLSEIFSKENILQTKKFDKNLAEKTRQICKLTKCQTRRVYEMSYLNGINRHDDEQMKRFRLIVKKRLFEPLQFDKRRRLQLSDPSLEALSTDPDKRKSYLSSQFEIVFQHYSNILVAFDKFQEKSS